jgi:hypothetical protein
LTAITDRIIPNTDITQNGTTSPHSRFLPVWCQVQ